MAKLSDQKFIHSVYFWLKRDLTPEQIETFDFNRRGDEIITPPPGQENRLDLLNVGLGKKSKQKNIFTAEVRTEGSFKEVGVFASPFAAFSRAKKIVSESAAASLRVTGPSGPVKRPLGLSPLQFRESEKEEGVFIERREKRIKSAGEKREITFKGIATQKARRSRGLFAASGKRKNIFG